MKKTFVKFKDLEIGDKFTVRFGYIIYTKTSENVGETVNVAKSFYRAQDVIKIKL